MRDSFWKRTGIALLLCFLTFLAAASAADTITASQSLRDNQSIVSVDDIFKLGFFTLDSPIVWVANRDDPIVNSANVLNIGADGSLVLHDQSIKLIWSSSNRSSSSPVVASSSILGTSFLSGRETPEMGRGDGVTVEEMRKGEEVGVVGNGALGGGGGGDHRGDGGDRGGGRGRRRGWPEMGHWRGRGWPEMGERGGGGRRGRVGEGCGDEGGMGEEGGRGGGGGRKWGPGEGGGDRR